MINQDLLNSLEEAGLTETQASSAVFRVVDHLLKMKLSDDVIDVGLYHNHRSNSADNMVESYKAILWACYEEIDND